jgi:SNF2 family DNA or RNA helicase
MAEACESLSLVNLVPSTLGYLLNWRSAMARLEDVVKGALVRGVAGSDAVSVIDVKWHGSDVAEVFYTDSNGKPGSTLAYRDQENEIEVAQAGARWSFTGDGETFRLAMEALRIRLAHHFDPYLALHTSEVTPLPHQITAVYEEMLPRQPLRFLLADDPGAGKTIMTGLLIKELVARGELQRCMIVSPGSLVEQWQDELWRKFGLRFDILTNDQLAAAPTGNWFAEKSLVICRLDKLSRNEEVQERIKACDWDLIVCDEAHKMSATIFGGEPHYTKRYRLGQLLSEISRNFLLLTATPHNGKESDFQLFMALLDGDRFETIARDGVHQADASDLMRRMVKENLLKFDQTPLFPERRAYTVSYTLSDGEAQLYKEVTDYVREQFNLAEQLSKQSKGNVGFALTSLQRRLASSPEAIYQSLRRRRERLERRLREEDLIRRGTKSKFDLGAIAGLSLDDEDPEAFDDLPEEEREGTEARLIDEASASQSIEELRKEIVILQRLEKMALEVKNGGSDRKWEELSKLLQERREMFDSSGARRKLVIFTEHRDTLNYLVERIGNALGRPEAVVTIHGGMGREERRNAQERFKQDKDTLILIATDAAGEGINLQRAHLMANYDLPWNPNRLEQRFGRIHRIGQEEVCHLWNMVATETREGDVYKKLLDKLEEERAALGGQVFDVLGQLVFDDQPLWKLLLDAVRYGDDPATKAKLFEKVEGALDTDALRRLIESRALVDDAMDASLVRRVREEMERAEARRLQPHFVESFFLRAFTMLNGSIRERENRRYEITHVPVAVRRRDREVGFGDAVLPKYERVTFERSLVTQQGKPLASFLCPGQPLLDSVISLVVERYRDVLKQGAILVDEMDDSETPRALVAIEHEITDGRRDKDGNRRIVSKRFGFVELAEDGSERHAGSAPYLDYRPLEDVEAATLGDVANGAWLGASLEEAAISYAAREIVPSHFAEVKGRREELVDKTLQAVHERLTNAINFWDNRAEELRLKEEAGKKPKLNSEKARARRDELRQRLERRTDELKLERQLQRGVPRVVGGCLVLPIGLLRKLSGADDAVVQHAKDTVRVERLAMDAVMELERSLGYVPKDVGAQKVGYDVESRRPDGSLRFIEVKGRVIGADTVTVTKNEVLTALNKPDDYFLAVVMVSDDGADRPMYVPKPFTKEPEFFMTTVECKIAELATRAVEAR